MNIKAIISKEVNIPVSMIDDALASARVEVKKTYITKRNGKKRLILQPSKKLKTIQYWLIINIFRKMAVHEAAIAYRDGISIFHNASKHKSNQFFLKLDLENFFPSIKFIDLMPKIEEWHNKEKPEWLLNEDAIMLIRQSCFYTMDSLAVGYPSSPIISNLVMFEFDTNLLKLVSNEDKFGKVIYTRYADDLIFSTNKKGVSDLLLKEVSKLILDTTSPNIVLNESKTKIGSSTGGSASVTGLKICDGERITIHRNQKDHIRLLLSLYRKEKLNNEEYSSLLGHLSYIQYVDSSFYTKLQNKYFREIAELRLVNSL